MTYKQHMEFYKNKYLLALYDEKDNLVTVFDNASQLSKWCGLPKEKIWQMIHDHKTGKIKFSEIKKQKMNIQLIEVK